MDIHPIPFSDDDTAYVSYLQSQIQALTEQLEDANLELINWRESPLTLNVFEQTRDNFCAASLPQITWTNNSFTASYDVSIFKWSHEDEFYEYWSLITETRDVPQYTWYITPVIKPEICVTARAVHNSKFAVDTINVRFQHSAQIADDSSWYLNTGQLYLKTPKDNQRHDFYIDYTEAEGSATMHINPSTPRFTITQN